FYVERSCPKTDKMIQRFYIKSGFFTPPFENAAGLQSRLSRMYSTATVGNVKSIAWFQCIK
ncbi:MAG: methyltransferase, partial [Clostridia bacterium]|nr:methyltransferase [Clostridia bacterium]